MKYKVDDTITLREEKALKREYGVNKDGDIRIPNTYIIPSEIFQYLGKKAKIIKVYPDYYTLDIDNGDYKWTDEMIAHNFTYGERIRVWNGDNIIYKRIFTNFTDGSKYPFETVHIEHNDKFKKGEIFQTSNYQYAEKIRKPEINKKQELQQELKDLFKRIGEIIGELEGGNE